MKRFLLLLAISGAVDAHQNSVTDSGKRMFLPEPQLGIEVINHPSSISLNETKSIVDEVLANWNLSGTQLRLNRNPSPSHFSVRFDNDFSRFGSAVVGITEINYNQDGIIQKATIRLNNNSLFSGSPSAHRLGGVYLGDVLSHEIGHLIGLNHSEVIESSMFYESFPGQHQLSKDDVAGVRSMYGSGFGVISGKVMGGNHVPVLGAQVKAISRLSGEAISGVSDEHGRFSIYGLDVNDSYYLYVSPTMKVGDLPSYYANTQNNFCPGSYQGGFFTSCGLEDAGSAQVIHLHSAQRAVDVGIVSINCSLRSSPEYARTKVEEESEPLLIWDSYRESVNEKNHIGYFLRSDEWSKWDKFKIDLRNISVVSDELKLKIGLIAYPFGNLLEYEMKVLKDEEVISENTLRFDPLTYAYHTNIFQDLHLSPMLSDNQFEIHIRARSLTYDCAEGICARWVYPSLSLLASQGPAPYLLSLGLMQGSNPLFNTEQALSDNSSCLDGPFTYAVARNLPLTEDEAPKGQEAGMSCGSIEPPSSPPEQGLWSMALGFMLVALSALLKKDKKTLS